MKIQIDKYAFCPEKFNNKGAFIAHNKSKHEDNYKKDASKRPCEECYYLAENYTTLREHKVSHHKMVSLKWMMIPKTRKLL